MLFRMTRMEKDWVLKNLGNSFKFLSCVLKKSQKQNYVLLSLLNLMWYDLRNSAGAFCVGVKVLSSNFSTEVVVHSKTDNLKREKP